MLGSPTRTVVGRPYVPSAEVVTVVEEQVRDAKVIIFKKRRRKNSRRTNGHRQVRGAQSRSMPLLIQGCADVNCTSTHARVMHTQQLTALRIVDIVEQAL